MRDTVRLFRWDPEAERFRLVPMSAAASPPDVAWGRVSESGIYVAIGIPSDPITRAALEVFRVMAPLEETIKARGDFAALTARICGLILCAPDISQLPVERFDEGVSVVPFLDPGARTPTAERPRERPRPPRALAPVEAAEPFAKPAWVCPHGTFPSSGSFRSHRLGVAGCPCHRRLPRPGASTGSTSVRLT